MFIYIGYWTLNIYYYILVGHLICYVKGHLWVIHQLLYEQKYMLFSLVLGGPGGR